jgi:flagellin
MNISLKPSYLFEKNQRAMQQTLEKLSSGKRINHSSDDAAGLAISTRMTSQIKGNQKGIENMENALNLLHTTDGSISSIQDHLIRMRELALQYQNGTLSSSDRTYIEQEWNTLKDSIDAISESAMFNGKQVLQVGKGMRFHGTKEQIKINYSADLNPQTFTASLWVKVDGNEGKYVAPLFSRYGEGTSGNYNLEGFNFYKTPEDQWSFWVGPGKGVKGFTTVNAPNKVDFGEWYHLLGSYDGEQMHFYINGTLIGSKTTAYVPTNKANIYIGAGSYSGGGYQLDGEMDDVKIYDRALTEDEISALYQGKEVNDGIIGDWDLGETENGQVKNQTGTGHDGKIEGNTEVTGSFEHIGVHTSEGTDDTFTFKLSTISTTSLGLKEETLADNDVIQRLDRAIDFVTNRRTEIGSYENSLKTRIETSYQTNENVTASRSRIEDTDMAEEMSELMKKKILTQTTLSAIKNVHFYSQQLTTLLTL